jgi:hypothetical protein
MTSRPGRTQMSSLPRDEKLKKDEILKVPSSGWLKVGAFLLWTLFVMATLFSLCYRITFSSEW